MPVPYAQIFGRARAPLAPLVPTAMQAIIQLLLYKLNPIIKYFAYLWLQVKKSLTVDSFSYLFKCN